MTTMDDGRASAEVVLSLMAFSYGHHAQDVPRRTALRIAIPTAFFLMRPDSGRYNSTYPCATSCSMQCDLIRLRSWEFSIPMWTSIADHRQLFRPKSHWLAKCFYTFMKNTRTPSSSRLAQMNWTVLAWAVGVPLPIVAIIALMRGCS